jgi:hypothetical protein
MYLSTTAFLFTALFTLPSTALPQATSTSAAVAHATPSIPTAPSLTYLFTVNLKLGRPLKPIEIPGGERIGKPIPSNRASRVVENHPILLTVKPHTTSISFSWHN